MEDQAQKFAKAIKAYAEIPDIARMSATDAMNKIADDYLNGVIRPPKTTEIVFENPVENPLEKVSEMLAAQRKNPKNKD